MKGTKALFSSRSDEWETPQGIFDELDKEFHFTLDACATDQNRKCDRYFTIEQNGLQKSWGGRQYSLILLTQRFLNGWLKLTTKERKITPSW